VRDLSACQPELDTEMGKERQHEGDGEGVHGRTRAGRG
jgi:hypothetical protein